MTVGFPFNCNIANYCQDPRLNMRSIPACKSAARVIYFAKLKPVRSQVDVFLTASGQTQSALYHCTSLVIILALDWLDIQIGCATLLWKFWFTFQIWNSLASHFRSFSSVLRGVSKDNIPGCGNASRKIHSIVCNNILLAHSKLRGENTYCGYIVITK